MEKNYCFFKYLILIFFLTAIFSMPESQAQFCSVNADIDEVICANHKMMLRGGLSGGEPGQVTVWSQIGGPTVNILHPDSLTTEVVNFLPGFTYTFRLSTVCSDGTRTFQDVKKKVLTVTTAEILSGDLGGCPGVSNQLQGTIPAAGEKGRWIIIGKNLAGLNIANDSLYNSSFTLGSSSCGTTRIQWRIESGAEGKVCRSLSDTVLILNYGGLSPVTASIRDSAHHCYSTTTYAQLQGSDGGCGGGQQGTWSVISGPNVPTFSNIHANSPVVSGLIEGIYTFRWTVSGPCVNGHADVAVPVFHATGDVTQAVASESQIVTCDPSVTSVMLEGNAPEYVGEITSWRILTQPVGANTQILDSTAIITEATNMTVGGVYRFVYRILNPIYNCYTEDTVMVYRYTNPPTLNITPNVIDLPCAESIGSIPYTHSGFGTVQYRIVSGPRSLLDTLKPFVYPTNWTNAGPSPVTVYGLTIRGKYLIEMRKHIDLGPLCSDVYDQVILVTSGLPVKANAGTPQILACNAKKQI